MKDLNVEFGAVFTLYCYENYGNKFFIKQVPQKYWDQIQKSEFIEIAYHGPFDFQNEMFNKQCIDFYKNISSSILSSRVRLHRYTCNEECISLLKGFGVNELLCREDKSRDLFGIESASYILSFFEESSLTFKPLIKDGIIYRKTDIRIEFYDTEELKGIIKDLCSHEKKDILVVYTHEKNILENKELLKNAVSILNNMSLKFVF